MRMCPDQLRRRAALALDRPGPGLWPVACAEAALRRAGGAESALRASADDRNTWNSPLPPLPWMAWSLLTRECANAWMKLARGSCLFATEAMQSPNAASLERDDAIRLQRAGQRSLLEANLDAVVIIGPDTRIDDVNSA